MTQIVNAASQVLSIGTEDLSKRTVPREPEAIPQHLPKFYIFAERGPKDPQLVSGAERESIFGASTFQVKSKFFNHATLFANLANEEGNICMLERLVPEDAGPEANLILWADVLETDVDLYERNADGSIKLTALTNEPIVDGTAAGNKIKFVVTARTSNGAVVPGNEDEHISFFGQAEQKTGDQTDGTNQSVRIPLLEFKVYSQGEFGNRCGIRLWAPTSKTVAAMPTKLMSENKTYPYFISVIEKATTLSSPKVVKTLFGEQKLMVTLKEGDYDPLTTKQTHINDIFIDSYQNLTDLRYPKKFGLFGDFHIYQENIDALLTQLHAAEVPFIDSFSDITANADSKYLMNLFGGVSSFGVPYHSMVFVDSVNSVRPSELTNIYADGGSDGTLNDTIHANLAIARLEEYLDPDSELQDIAYHVESHFYDSGYPLEAKLAMCCPLALRKNTVVNLSTFDVNDRTLTAAEEYSLAIALRTRMRMYPESEYFGTPVMRGTILTQSAKLRNSEYKKRVPMTAELLIKSAKYMGASSGRWSNGSNFDGAPGSVIDSMYDISNPWTPVSVRYRNWDAGITWTQRYDRRSFYFPAIKTVYDDDTSVLNSYNTICAIATLNRIAQRCHREFSGVDHLTNAQLAERVNDFINKSVLGIFDNRFIIVPDAFFTDTDTLRGYSWTLPIKLYAANMKTVMTTYVQAYRLDDLEA